MVTRADFISQLEKKIDTYSDFSNNFQKHPLTNELIVIKNEEAVRQAFKNLILTNIGERFFNPFFGSDIRKSLFENFTPFLIEDIKRYIFLSVSQFEPRISIINITVLDDSDRNEYSINVVFTVANRPEPVNVTLFLKKVR